MKKKMMIRLFLTLLAISSIANAQSIKDQIRAEGKSIFWTKSVERWQPLWQTADNSNIKVTYDVKYGPGDKQGFDIYEPIEAPELPSPVIVFLHGGSFVAGDKSQYANVGYHFANKGITTVVMTYRLAPEFKWPTGTLDLALQLKWIRDHSDQLISADTSQIFLFGHSAGAQHVASYIFEEEYQIKNDGVAGAILASGSVYDTTILNGDADPQYYDYFGKDPSKYDERSILKKLDGRKVPVFITYAEYDKGNFQYQASKIIPALFARDGEMPAVKQIMDHNHLSEVFHFNTGEENFSDDIVKFIDTSLYQRNK
ncbi:MAG: alpha/beta hydrolase [Emcibacteraceae bacterium]|nr:alpha/beta hydrolase [Emcibacteraceae bacterium]